MREVNLHNIDLNLLPALEALLRRCNVSQAAGDAGLSQPAMSRALARLRHVFDDPLLVRAGGGFVLTPKAISLQPRINAALQNMTGLFEEPGFDPAQASRRIRMAATDMQTIMFAPKLMARLAVEAPGIELSMEHYSRDISTRMENGSLDFVFALANTNLPLGTVSESLGMDELALVMRRDHPAAKRRWTVEDYGLYDHVSIAIMGDGYSELDAQLAAHGVKRRIALVTPHFVAALANVAQTDLITTISKQFAKHHADFYRLVLHKPPLDNIALESTLVWSHLRNSDKVLTWFRGIVKEVARDVYELTYSKTPAP